MIVANDATAFDSDTNAVTMIGRDGRPERLPEMPKRQVADLIIERIVKLAE